MKGKEKKRKEEEGSTTTRESERMEFGISVSSSLSVAPRELLANRADNAEVRGSIRRRRRRSEKMNPKKKHSHKTKSKPKPKQSAVTGVHEGLGFR